MKLFELDNALLQVAVHESEQDPIVAARELITNAPTGDDVVAELPDLIAQYAGHPLIDGIKEIMTNFTDASEITLLVDDLIAHYESTRDGIEEATARRKIPNNVGEVRKRLRDAGFNVRYTDKTKLGYSLKIRGPGVRAYDKNDTDTKEFKQALQKAQTLAKKVESVVGNDGTVKLTKFYDRYGNGYEFNIRVIVEEEDAPYAHPETAMAVDEAEYEGGIDFEPDAAFAGVKGVTTATGAGEKGARDAGHKAQGEKVNAHWIKLLKAVKGMEADNPKRKELVQNLKQMASVANKQGFELSPPAEKVFGLQSN